MKRTQTDEQRVIFCESDYSLSEADKRIKKNEQLIWWMNAAVQDRQIREKVSTWSQRIRNLQCARVCVFFSVCCQITKKAENEILIVVESTCVYMYVHVLLWYQNKSLCFFARISEYCLYVFGFTFIVFFLPLQSRSNSFCAF